MTLTATVTQILLCQHLMLVQELCTSTGEQVITWSPTVTRWESHDILALLCTKLIRNDVIRLHHVLFPSALRKFPLSPVAKCSVIPFPVG